jgi:hypothetical protein
MGLAAVSSAVSDHRIARGREWLNARRPAEEVLIIGASLGAANELARGHTQQKQASFGCFRLSLGQLASALAQSALAAQQAVPLAALGTQAVTNRVIHKLSEAGELGRYTKLTNGPGFARCRVSAVAKSWPRRRD